MITIHETIQGTKEWHALRKGLYTGSNAHKLLGSIGTAEHALSLDSNFKGNFFTRRGHILEDEALDLYETIYNIDVSRPGFITNSNYPTAGYSPDGIAGKILIEVKCFNIEKHMKIAKGDIPLAILAQAHFGMMICELKLAHLVLYNPEIETARDAFIIMTIKADRDIKKNFARILEANALKVQTQ